MIITGKLYEYLKSEKPILAIAESDGDAARIINDTASGSVFDYDDAEGITSFLNKEDHQKPIQVEQFSRRELTKTLVNVLEETAI